MARGKPGREKLNPSSASVDLKDLTDIDLRLLRVFAAVVEAGGFSGAQVELNIGQSTISTHMAELESRIGLRLCRRGRSGFALTPYGAAVYEACQALFSALDEFRSTVGEVRNQIVGSLNIGMLDNTITDPSNKLPEAIARFRETAPLVRINMVITSPSEIGRAIVDNRLHIGMTTAHHREPGLDYDMIYLESQHLYCGRGHPLFESTPFDLRVADIGENEFVSRGYDEGRQTIYSQISSRPSALAHHLEGVATMILSGRYLGIMPVHYAKIWADDDRLRPLRPDLLEDKTPIYLVTKRRARAAPTLTAFRNELAKLYSNSGQAADPAQ